MSMTSAIKFVIKSLPGIREVVAERDQLLDERGIIPPGHFYSPIPSLAEVRRDESRIFGTRPRTIPGVEMNEKAQLRLLEEFVDLYESMPFTASKSEGFRYCFDNPAYSYSDAIHLHCMLRHLKPKRVVEVGSGYSSCVTLDTCQHFIDTPVATTFIEPYPELLTSLILDSDRQTIKIIPERLQDVDLDVFKALEQNDVLFIDSTHVGKVNSDVNRIFFEILPALSPGVHIHFHDVFYPFEYPKEWIYQGRSWNELYMLRAFLQYNSEFDIVLMNTFMQLFHRSFFEEKMPLCLKNSGGSIWLRKGKL